MHGYIDQRCSCCFRFPNGWLDNKIASMSRPEPELSKAIEPNEVPPGRLQSWLQLLRIPNLATAISNILLAFLVVHDRWTPVLPLALLIVASSSIYLAGMVLNDYFDFEQDLQERPDRPLPSGQISRSTAGWSGIALLALGLVAAFAAGLSVQTEGGHQALRTTLVAAILATLVVLYDGPMKKSWLSPVLMGGCRFFNILLGASTIPDPSLVPQTGWLLFWIAAVTRCFDLRYHVVSPENEAQEEQHRPVLIFGGLLMILALIGFSATGFFAG